MIYCFANYLFSLSLLVSNLELFSPSGARFRFPIPIPNQKMNQYMKAGVSFPCLVVAGRYLVCRFN